MRNYYFFTDPTKLAAQRADQAFGHFEEPGSNFDNYRTTSLHSPINANTKVPAIAVCNGTICVQPSGIDTFNIILKPDYQPSFKFPHIKYFIYKGIKKSSLIKPGTNEIIDPGTIPFINEIHKTHEWEKPEITPATPISDSGNILGLYYQEQTMSSTDISYGPDDLALIFNNDKPIDNFFYYNNAYSKFALPSVKAGDLIGEFASHFGFEIIVERFGYDAEIHLARNPVNVLKIASIADPLNLLNDSLVGRIEFSRHWRAKEASLIFVDPCAFFGSFGQNVLYYMKNELKSPFDNNVSLYKDLISIVFKNKNRLYLRISDSQLNSYLLWQSNREIEITNFQLPQRNQLWPDLVIEMDEPNLLIPETKTGVYLEYYVIIPALEAIEADDETKQVEGFFATKQSKYYREIIKRYVVKDREIRVSVNSGYHNKTNCSTLVELCLSESNEILSSRNEEWRLYRILETSSLKYKLTNPTNGFGLFPIAQPFIGKFDQESVISQMAYFVGPFDIYIVAYPLKYGRTKIKSLVPKINTKANEDTLSFFLHQTNIKSYRIRVKNIEYPVNPAPKTQTKDINIIGRDLQNSNFLHHELYTIIAIDREKYNAMLLRTAVQKYVKVNLVADKPDYNEYLISSKNIEEAGNGMIQQSSDDLAVKLRAFEAKEVIR